MRKLVVTSRLPTGALVAIFALVGLVPLVLLAYLSVSHASDAVKREATARVRAVAAGRADAVGIEMSSLADLVESYSRRPTLVAAVADGELDRDDRAGIARHLRELREARAGEAIAFIADPRGILIDIVPATPSIVGNDFSFRDWYRGVIATQAPYVSEAYVTAAKGNERVVAAAAPVRAANGEMIAILVGAYRLGHIQAFVERFQATQGVQVTVADQAGNLIASPGGAPKGLEPIGADARVAAALKGETGDLSRSTPSGQELSAYAPVPDIGWAVVASVPEKTAFAGVVTLRRTVFSIAGLLALVFAAGLALLARALGQRAQSERRAEQARRDLAMRNEQLEAAHIELEHQNTELELHAVELEDHQAQLSAANDELETQRAEIEYTLVQLEEEKARVDVFYAVAGQLAVEEDVSRLAEISLREIADFADAAIGAIYIAADDDAPPGLEATRAVDRGRFPAELHPGDGLAGRALAEKRALVSAHGDGALRLAAFGEEVAVRHELHVPLLQGERCVGVISLARTSHTGFEPATVEAIEHLARGAATALGKALAFRMARHLADVNRAVVNATRDGIGMVDLDGNILVTNAALVRIAGDAFGVDPSGKLAEVVERIAGQTTDPDAYRAAIAAATANPSHEATDEYRLADSGRTFQRYTAPVIDSSGEPIGRIFVLREITAEREADRLKSDLLSTVSHELRTPLASIVGYSELLSARDPDPETARRYGRTIHSEGRRLSELIDDFLDLQRIEQGSFTLDLQPFELAEVLRHQVELFSAQSAQHRVELDVNGGALGVVGERNRIAQVVANLLSNAIKYSPEGGTVTVVAARERGAVRVRVRDEGIGIPAEQQDRIFAKFFRVDSSDTRAIGGTGLGLALAREIVEAHGGAIGFESEEGRGSTFWFELPDDGAARGSRGIGPAEDGQAAA